MLKQSDLVIYPNKYLQLFIQILINIFQQWIRESLESQKLNDGVQKEKAVISSPLFSHPWWVTKLSSMEELGGHLSRVSLDELKKDNGEVSLASVGLFFPREIFFEILSWLPVKYLVRCKCVLEEKLNVIVLEDHRKNKWSKTNIVIHLTFLKENPDLKKNIVPTLFDNGKLWFCSEHKDSDQVLQYVYNTESRELTQIALAGAGAGAAGKRSYIACPSSVVTFKRNAIGEDTSIQTRIGPR
ncbi:hypothetical protein Q3G72_018532 [Acer saccharum]|nr:hypothetical protein Q3G72_018532 [Acer saccharum]